MAALSEEQLLPFALLEEPSSQETETQLLDDLLVHEVMRDSIQQFTNDRGARIRKIQASIDNILRQLEKGGVATHGKSYTLDFPLSMPILAARFFASKLCYFPFHFVFILVDLPTTLYPSVPVPSFTLSSTSYTIRPQCWYFSSRLA